MSTPMVPARTTTGRLNKMSVAAIIFAVIAASGLLVFGVAVLAVFAGGAGTLPSIRSAAEANELGGLPLLPWP